MNWEVVPECNFCGSHHSKPFLGIETRNWYDGRPLNLVECIDCHLVRATPRPNRYELFRNSILGSPAAVELIRKRLGRPNAVSIHRRAVKEAVDAVRHPVRTLYDMGFGAGTALMAAATLGIQGEGNDINLAAVKMLQGIGFRVRQGFTSELDFADTKFDVLLNLEYIEQSYEPFTDLKRCYELLNAGGALYLKTIYLGCPEHDANGEASVLFGAGRFHYFTPETLSGMLANAGFRIVTSSFASTAKIIAVHP
jgi:2-polyprenyl-3-methyl-5-hydroxy-6-metoxy-1,4-benzoquinol methylase